MLLESMEEGKVKNLLEEALREEELCRVWVEPGRRNLSQKSAAFVDKNFDDLVFLVEANSRRTLEERATSVINEVQFWCGNNKLTLSAEKTVAMLLKGTLDVARPPTVVVTGFRLRWVQQLKYLGLLLDTKLSFLPHVVELRNKSVCAINIYLGNWKKIQWQRSPEGGKNKMVGVGSGIANGGGWGRI